MIRYVRETTAPCVTLLFPTRFAGKPDWFIDLNPKGEVPVIVVDGEPIVGSEETIDYLMQGPLNPDERRAISSSWRGIVNDLSLIHI